MVTKKTASKVKTENINDSDVTVNEDINIDEFNKADNEADVNEKKFIPMVAVTKELNNEPNADKSIFKGEYYWLDAIEQNIRTRSQKIDSIIPTIDMLDSEAIDCVFYFSLYTPRTGYIKVHYDDLYVEYYIDRLFNSLDFNNEHSRIIFIKSLADFKDRLNTRKLKNTFKDIPENVLIELIKKNTNIIDKIKKDIL